MNRRILSLIHNIIAFCSRYQLRLSFGGVLIGVVLLDIGFNSVFLALHPFLDQLLPGNQADTFGNLQIAFAPEVWLSLIGLTLGTLVIVISIAAQTIPKIAELYMTDWFSLLYIWFLILGGTHSILVKFHQEADITRTSSVILNLYFLLPISSVLAFPYIIYVLRSIQPNTVIKRIVKKSLRQIRNAAKYSVQRLIQIEPYREEYQYRLLESLNQVDNLLEYFSSKEPKAQVIQNIGLLIREYMKIKPLLNPYFFGIGSSIRSDISFKTMIDQFPDMERSKTFYEQKGFRILGNVYVNLMEDKQFDLAALCASEMSRIGFTALTLKDNQLLEVIIIRFNTMMRFALKHGVKHNEARHLYNLAFHYQDFIQHLVGFGKICQSQQCFYYLRTYGNEAYGHGRNSPAMYFIVDVFAAEMKKILILVYQHHWPLDIQRQLLDEMLQVDSPPELDIDSPVERHLNSGVRTLQIGLGLFYLKAGQLDFVRRIIVDLLDDLEVLGEATFRQTIQRTCDRLTAAQPTFWEDTDRGNTNLYYSPDQTHIEHFCKLLYDSIPGPDHNP